MTIKPLLLLLPLGMAACGGAPATEPVTLSAEAIGQPSGKVFELAESQALLGRAGAAEQAGDGAGAMRFYREAGLAWPASEAAWTGLARTARLRGDAGEANAAAFMLDRLDLYPSTDMATQRAINVALKDWISTQRGTADANPAQLHYAEALAEFHDGLRAMAGTYEPPLPFGNVGLRDAPAAIATGAGVVVYGVLLVTGN